MLPIFFAVYGTVFLAEIVGDKLLYTTGILATRYRPLPIVFGMSLAFALKMGIAVWVGGLISKLPPLLIAAVTAINFFGIALVLWRKPDTREVKPETYPSSRAVLMSFAAIFFSEWGDVGQLTAAGMAVNFPNAPLMVWLGAVTAMVTKGVLAASFGAFARKWIQDHFAPKTIRYAAVGILALLGILSVFETLEGHEGAMVLISLLP